MAEDEARRRFTTGRVARLASVDAGLRPHLVPVVFAANGEEIVTAVDWKPKKSQRLKRLDEIAAHPAVCLLVDVYDEDGERVWWVRADGDARVLPPGTQGEYQAAVALLREKYGAVPAATADRSGARDRHPPVARLACRVGGVTVPAGDKPPGHPEEVRLPLYTKESPEGTLVTGLV
ncbi:TIGR03668 family PPOX class F420-dependent oxidoreductase [Streptomyces sp. NPDC096040]|uniref:TIGR03668 family PPOX class F420-dependent oxidoreductase n=1 Tax=Streptomyces sp. NPDC096040 TaxID=3155541 RepID=UPI00333487D9